MPTVAGVLVRGQTADMLWIVQLYWQLPLLVRSVCHLAWYTCRYGCWACLEQDQRGARRLKTSTPRCAASGLLWRCEQSAGLTTLHGLLGRPVWSCAPVDERSPPSVMNGQVYTAA